MSAIISNDVQMKEILKATGYDCPADLEGKTFNEATSGGGGGGSSGGGSSGGGSSGGGATTTKKLNAKEIRTSVESEQAITPPEGYDGFSEITFTPGLLSEVTVTKNQTMEFGTDDVLYFPKKLTVSVPSPSNYTLETLSLDKNSEPVTISYADKVFVFLGKIETWGELVGIGGTADKLLYEKSVNLDGGGATAGTVSLDPDAKTITYTPNTSYNMGSVNITKLII